MKLSFWFPAVALVLLSVCPSQSPGQTAAAVSATIQFSNGQTITVTDFSNPIDVQPGEFLNITIQFPANAAGQPIVIKALDGGATSVGNSIRVINNDGTFNFVFTAPASTGTKSLDIHSGSNIRLKFSVNNASGP
jgi:hypothetical protein